MSPHVSGLHQATASVNCKRTLCKMNDIQLKHPVDINDAVQFQCNQLNLTVMYYNTSKATTV